MKTDGEQATMSSWAEEAFDSIDAGFFSGDTFENREAIARAEWYMQRWQQKITETKKSLDLEEYGGKCYFAPDGMLMSADGTRSIFDDVDE